MDILTGMLELGTDAVTVTVMVERNSSLISGLICSQESGE